MAVRGPLVTAGVVLVGLAGFLVVNSVGGLVAARSSAVPATTEAVVQPAPSTTTEATVAPTTTAAPAFPAEVVYAGRASTGRVAIAVAVKGGQAAAYLCDGRNVEAWLRGSATQGRVDLAGQGGSLAAALDGGRLAGTATVGGQQYPFTIDVAGPPAGLYRGSNGSTTIGWIVLPDGSQVGIATSGGSSAAAPELDPRNPAVTVDGQRISAAAVAGDTTFG